MAVDLTEGVTPPPEKSVDLFDVLGQLPLMTDYLYLQMQAGSKKRSFQRNYKRNSADGDSFP